MELVLSTGQPSLTVDVVVVFAVVAVTLLLFVLEPIPIDVSAILMLVVLVVLEPWTQITPELAISGFSNPATITVLAMFVLSEGVKRTGSIRIVGDRVIEFTGDDERKQLAAVIGLSGSTAGVINNTPVVAVLIPFVTDLAERTNTSPSKLFIPLSYAAMLGGMLTLVGTSPSILASDISDRLIGRPYSMFTFTHLGVLVLLTGAVYLLTIGHRLIPERIDPDEDLSDRFETSEYVTEVTVPPDAAVVGETVGEVVARIGRDAEILRILRHGKIIHRDIENRTIRAGDHLLFRGRRRTLLELASFRGLEFSAEPIVEPVSEDDGGTVPLVEVIVVPGESALASESITASAFRRRFDAPILAIRRQGELVTRRLSKVVLRGGDTLLVQANEGAFEELRNDPDYVVTEEVVRPDYRTSRIPVAVGIVVGVVLVAAAGYLPVEIAALGGMAAMVVTGCVEPREVYDAVDWNVIFLLAGVIPLGIALEETGGAEYLALQLTPMADVVPLVVFLMIFYMLTAIVTEIITNLASVALMIPIGVDVATQLGANPFSFVLLVTFAASDSLMTPVGYQTNLMVYDRGGYRFTDYMRVGIPLQLLLAVVTSLGIVVFWGV
ncbi:SLC13 family permease [Natrialbaceae archaeon AArc-T1-2]|uniref:SLC13 family permease n=1 Tax=Natrialbaceae archaeon AArc-T1-2 TaxID=3053904 RepID=UPI00255A8E6C|nr:SLC13 family permease [Natrialbaceae archaeon AArc-T1-2]WIV68505.1 SLC13 family permease [Natrialbaceae archaeon AArc-T1-2]